jgi:hypothetical protein
MGTSLITRSGWIDAGVTNLGFLSWQALFVALTVPDKRVFVAGW